MFIIDTKTVLQPLRTSLLWRIIISKKINNLSIVELSIVWDESRDLFNRNVLPGFSQPLTFKALNYFCINHGEQWGFFQIKIIINVLVSSFWFIWIPMLWVYENYKYFYSYSAGIDFSRQNLTSKRQILTTKVDPRTVRVKALKLIV